MISVQTFSSDKTLLWNDFVTSAKNATFLFQRDFMDYHNHRFEDNSLLCFKNETLIAVLPANKTQNEVHSHQGLTYGGIVVHSSLKFSDFLAVVNAILRFLEKAGTQFLFLKSLPTMYTKWPSEELAYLNFILKAELVRTDVASVLPLSGPLQLSKDRMAGVKRGIKSGLEIREETSFESFWNKILIPNLQEKHQVLPTHSLKEINLLKQRFPNVIRQFNVYENNEIVAGTTIFETEMVAHSQYMSALQNKNTNGSLDFLHHYLFTEVFQDKKWFDFGISNENQGKTINKGLLYWKEGFGARTQVYQYHKIAVANHSLLNTILQ